MRWLIGIVALLAAFAAEAADFELVKGSNCTITWDPNPESEGVDLYLLMVVSTESKEKFSERVYVTATEVSCSDLLIDSYTEMEYQVLVKAHNATGWGEEARVKLRFIDAGE